jgi:EAL domain-containing protein (putative c-di-GMP-specific phosphodiesterase class I)
LSGPALWKFDRDARMQAIKVAAALGLTTKINLNLLPESLLELGGNAMFSTIDAATAHGLRLEQIVFEVSESETIKDFDLFMDLANACRAMGAKLPAKVRVKRSCAAS